MFAAQVTAQDTAKIEVVEFNWSMYERERLLDASPILDEEATNRPNRNNRMREKTIEEQSQELARIENAARRSALAPPGKVFLYALKIKHHLDGKPSNLLFGNINS